MSDKPDLMDFTRRLSEQHGTNASPSKAGQLGEFYFKCDETKEYVFRWDGDEWTEVGIVEFENEHKALRRHRELCDTQNEEVGWRPEQFVETYS